MVVRVCTPRQLAVIQAHVATGSVHAAAERLDISHSTARSHLAAARIRMGVQTTEQMVYILTRMGALVVPECQMASADEPTTQTAETGAGW